jgi:hypothetical protein
MSRIYSDGAKLHFLAGEVNGLRAVVMALVDSHPDPKYLRDQIERLWELQIGVSTPLAVTEDFIDGQTQTNGEFLARVNELIDDA